MSTPLVMVAGCGRHKNETLFGDTGLEVSAVAPGRPINL